MNYKESELRRSRIVTHQPTTKYAKIDKDVSWHDFKCRLQNFEREEKHEISIEGSSLVYSIFVFHWLKPPPLSSAKEIEDRIIEDLKE